jgi:hypothetical protein
MGCNIGSSSASTSRKKLNELSKQRIVVNADDTIVNGICLKSANVGHYFAESELIEVKKNTMKRRMAKWSSMCSHSSLTSSII